MKKMVKRFVNYINELPGYRKGRIVCFSLACFCLLTYIFEGADIFRYAACLTFGAGLGYRP